ncbi:MAG TPA: hypothetical protein PKL11_08125, partial [Anaerolineaceae bacterium]|nr:hypothetical protein [Anaerolineaceae bacterium]
MLNQIAFACSDITTDQYKTWLTLLANHFKFVLQLFQFFFAAHKKVWHCGFSCFLQGSGILLTAASSASANIRR